MNQDAADLQHQTATLGAPDAPAPKRAPSRKRKEARRPGGRAGVAPSRLSATAANAEPKQAALPFPHELIIDNFAGGGGTSEGLEQAFGRPVDIAINHDPEALAMHAINHPHTLHLCESVWDVNPVEVTKNQPVALVWLSPDCFPAGTLVLTRRGYRAIETIEVGDEVLTHRGRWRRVTETSSARRPLLSVRGHGHPGLRVSPEHPFYVRAHQRDSADWVPASAIGKGQYWATPCAFPAADVPAIPKVRSRSLEITPSLLWLAGRYVGDGWTRLTDERAELVITCSAKEAEALRQVLTSAWPRAGARCTSNEMAWHERTTRTAVQFATSHRGLVMWLREHFGHRAENKGLPAWALGMAPDLRAALLSGYLSADGCRTPSFYEARTVSKALAFSVKALASSMGHTVTVYTGANTTVIEGRSVNARPYWLLRWRHQVAADHRQTFRQAHLEWTPIRERGTPSGMEAVYNIGVEQDESYVVEGIVVHNCKHFSKAKGGTPVSKNIRGLAWVGMRWIATTNPRVLMLENVSEFVSWGPLLCEINNGVEEWKPDPTKKGVTFQSFVRQLRGHGYEVEWRELRACDNGAPTIRKRLFLIARRDGLPIVWPEQTHAEPTHRDVIAGNLEPYRTAAECIDFSLPAQSIFGRKRDLARNTQRRVAKGLWKHVLTSLTPYIVNTRNGEREGQDARTRSLGEPYWTVTGLGSQGALSQPVLAPFVPGAGGPKTDAANQPFGASLIDGAAMSAPFLTEHANSSTQRTFSAQEPLRTTCAQVKGGHFSVVEPRMAPLIVTNTSGHPGAAVDAPLPTLTTGNHQALVAPVLTPLRGTEEGHLGGDSIEDPLSTISAGGTHHAMVSAHLTHLTHHGERSGYGVDEPFKTITGANRGEQAVVAACLEQAYGGFYEDNHGRAVDAPISTIMSKGANQRLIAAQLEQADTSIEACLSQRDGVAPQERGSQAPLVNAYMVKYYSSGGQWQDLTDPIHTLPTKGRMGLVQSVTVPADCMDAVHRDKARACALLLHEHLPEQFPQPAEMVLVFQQGQWWVLVDITLRMLKPRELFNAQGFPKSYVIEEIPDPQMLFVNGVQVANPLEIPRIPLSATAQVRMCGNSVSPYQSKVLALANFQHEAAFGVQEAA